MAINETDPELKVNQQCVCEARKRWGVGGGVCGCFVQCTVYAMHCVCTVYSHPADTISCLHCFNLTLNVQCVKYFSRAFMNESNMHTHFLCFALLYFTLLCSTPIFVSPQTLLELHYECVRVRLCVFFTENCNSYKKTFQYSGIDCFAIHHTENHESLY